MELRIELCGRLADALGREVVLACEDATTVREILDRFSAMSPQLAGEIERGRVRACVNETLVTAEHAVIAGDLVALFPPVSGG